MSAHAAGQAHEEGLWSAVAAAAARAWAAGDADLASLRGATERVHGGLLNFTYRHTPLEVAGHPAPARTVIVKVIPPHIATAPTVPLDVQRAAFERRGLMMAPLLLSQAGGDGGAGDDAHGGGVVVSAPTYLGAHVPATSAPWRSGHAPPVVIMSDCGAGPSLEEWMAAVGHGGDADAVVSHVGGALGHAIAGMHAAGWRAAAAVATRGGSREVDAVAMALGLAGDDGVAMEPAAMGAGGAPSSSPPPSRAHLRNQSILDTRAQLQYGKMATTLRDVCGACAEAAAAVAAVACEVGCGSSDAHDLDGVMRRVDAVCRDVGAWLSSYTGDGCTWVHGDLWPRSILVRSTPTTASAMTLFLIDWEMSTWACPTSDTSHFVAHCYMQAVAACHGGTRALWVRLAVTFAAAYMSRWLAVMEGMADGGASVSEAWAAARCRHVSQVHMGCEVLARLGMFKEGYVFHGATHTTIADAVGMAAACILEGDGEPGPLHSGSGEGGGLQGDMAHALLTLLCMDADAATVRGFAAATQPAWGVMPAPLLRALTRAMAPCPPH